MMRFNVGIIHARRIDLMQSLPCFRENKKKSQITHVVHAVKLHRLMSDVHVHYHTIQLMGEIIRMITLQLPSICELNISPTVFSSIRETKTL